MKNENINITWLRAIACMMVVAIHGSVFWNSVPNPLFRFIDLSIWHLSAVAVPLFAMISGYLLFSKDEEPSLALAGKRFWAIFKLIAYFGTIYYLYDTLKGLGNYPYVRILLYSQGGHLWYLYALLPAYSLSAFIRLPKNHSQKFYLGFLIIVSLILFVTEIMKNPPFSIASAYTNYNFNLLFVYMVLGFILGNLKGNKPFFFFTAYMILSMTAICLIWYGRQTGPYLGNLLGYSQSLAFFLGMMHLNIETIILTPWGRLLHKFFGLIAKYSLGIYGWHMISLLGSKLFYEGLGLSGRYVFLLTLASTLLFSLLISMADTWFWTRVRFWLAALWQKISTRLQKT